MQLKAGELPPQSFLGVEALWLAGVSTTAITARPYQRLTTVSGGVENIDRVVSGHLPLATERGGRIVAPGRSSNLVYTALDAHELDAIADIDGHENVDFVGFYPQELLGTSFIWAPDKFRNEELASRFGHDAIILANNQATLRRALDEANPCLVTVKFKVDHTDNTKVLDDGLNVAWERRTGAVVAQGIDKLTALEAICDASDVPLEAVRYAGNDTSDRAVLRLPELRERIFVGGNNVSGIAEPATHLETPEALGDYLLSLPDTRSIA